MSRSGYSYDLDQWDLIRYRGAVKSSIRGKRGQKFLTDLLEALDALPSKRLIKDELQDAAGDVCALGSLAIKRGMSLAEIDPEDSESTSSAFGIAEALARETVYENDEAGHWKETPEQCFARVRAWVVENISTEDAKP